MDSQWQPATAADDSSIFEMSAELYIEDPSIRPVPPEQTLATLAELRRNPVRGQAWALRIDGRAEGYALLINFWSNELGGEICTVDELFVRKNHRGKGHGRALLTRLLEEKRFRAIDLEVTPANGRARKFYESLGFGALKNAHLRARF